MNMKGIHEGLGIFLKYDPDGYCQGEHDEIFASQVYDELRRDEIVRLEDLGWRYEDGYWTCFT